MIDAYCRKLGKQWKFTNELQFQNKPAQAPCWNSVSKEGKKSKRKGNRGRNTAEGQLEAGAGFPET